MGNALREQIKEKLFLYLQGENPLENLYKWALEDPHLSKRAKEIKDKSDIRFYLLEEAGIDLRNYYVDSKIIIKEKSLRKKLSEYASGKLGEEDLCLWADDAINWELVEGCENEAVRTILKNLASNQDELMLFKKGDIDILLELLGKNKSEFLQNRINLLFSMPFFRQILNSKETEERLYEKIRQMFNESEKLFDGLSPTLKELLKDENYKESVELLLLDTIRGVPANKSLSKLNRAKIHD